ncbi:hypothetical protein QO034_08660 [Sedimentitalea sp. JM2-8]|uniref:UDP-N-acetylglucosamine kinase n=1 Tax=Sedimentitalea xiamensis TaxID=3050037 RepID=A0ABT7FDI6_9RHOB|nr:hypothetical protein [Sedimentitalea xiamensis]MDK3073176.1 hypothetical protein [Sedimentitalea xiamensis]
MSDTSGDFHAWNPGLTSQIPADLLPGVTLFRPENSLVSYAEAKEAAEFCGRKPAEMNAFTASRLVTHELLVRLMADINVPDGPEYPELGAHLRSMAATILDGYIRPQMPLLEREFDKLRNRIGDRLAARLDQDVYARKDPAADQPAGLIARLTGSKPKPAESESAEVLALLQWQAEVDAGGDKFEIACLRGLLAIVGGIVGQRGRLVGDKDLVVRWATNWVANGYGSLRIGQMIQPMIRDAATREGYRILPFQSAPLFMSVKGGPGAGKSTLRPLQRELAVKLGVPWEDFAKVSPDYCRKFLLDYDSLGKNAIYAASLTGQELEILDKKIDLYMEQKAERSEMPHVLVDRFRFDSFMPAPFQKPGGTLLSRFADTVYLFFMITPPQDTVERAWQRGLKTGRYKALDDMLHFNIEANIGMPQLFFNWVRKTNQKIHFEFLDNSVPMGERPRTAAFGWNNSLTILDPGCLRSIDRYRNINIDATNPEEVLLPGDPPGGDILEDCLTKVGHVTFADQSTLQVQAQTRDGQCVFESDGFLASLSLGEICQRLADRAGGKTKVSHDPAAAEPVDADTERKFTVGQWGGD